MSGWIGVDLDGTLARYDGWRGSFFAPCEKVTIRADPTPTLVAGLGRYEAIAGAAGISAAEVQSVLDDVIEEIATELLDDCWRSRIATRLTEWQREQAA